MSADSTRARIEAAEPAPIFVQWERTTGELFDRMAKLPKAHRFTFAQRIENLALDILELLASAQWSSGATKAQHLRQADERLLRLRVLLRLCHAQRHLDHRAYEHLARQLDETGRALGGWRRHAEPAPDGSRRAPTPHRSPNESAP